MVVALQHAGVPTGIKGGLLTRDARCSLDLCTIPEGYKWARRASARCRDCLSEANLCEAPPRLLIHQYLNHLDKDDWRGNLLSLKAYLMTQVLHLVAGGFNMIDSVSIRAEGMAYLAVWAALKHKSIAPRSSGQAALHGGPQNQAG